MLEGSKRSFWIRDMASPKDMFEHGGPTKLSFVDWNCPHQRRSVVACLVQGAYLLERDRTCPTNLKIAPPWWEFFYFTRRRKLIDDSDGSIFGVIYQYSRSDYNPSTESAPRYVVAFRGTIINGEAIGRDFELNSQLLVNNLHTTSRLGIAMQAVKDLVARVGSSKIWLAGHSLGAALASLVGKTMVKDEVLLETYLFNPPIISLPIEKIKDGAWKQRIRIAGSILAAFLSVIKREQDQLRRSEESFSTLASWIPNLFLNPKDPICSEYIAHFEHRKRMEQMGAMHIERLASQNPLGDFVLAAFGQESAECSHLFPSARLTINRSYSPDFRSAHGLAQWWRPDLNLQCLSYLDC